LGDFSKEIAMEEPMDEHRKSAYRDLLYWAMLDIRTIVWPRLWNPFRWASEIRRIRRVGALADWLHNVALFSSLDFNGFDEDWFWREGRSLENRHPGLGLERYQHVFEDRLAAAGKTL
jgi:hypothetical protein